MCRDSFALRLPETCQRSRLHPRRWCRSGTSGQSSRGSPRALFLVQESASSDLRFVCPSSSRNMSTKSIASTSLVPERNVWAIFTRESAGTVPRSRISEFRSEIRLPFVFQKHVNEVDCIHVVGAGAERLGNLHAGVRGHCSSFKNQRVPI